MTPIENNQVGTTARLTKGNNFLKKSAVRNEKPMYVGNPDNKIPQEIEEVYTNTREIEIHCKAFDKGFEKGQKQNVDDVLKLIDELKNRVESEKWDYDDKYMSIDIQRSRVVEWIEELKAQIKNGGKK